jgi:hypothetical protein
VLLNPLYLSLVALQLSRFYQLDGADNDPPPRVGYG